MKVRIAIFASGSGSNAENIVRHFIASEHVSVPLILTNNPSAGVIERAGKLNIPCLVFNREEFLSDEFIRAILEKERIDFIVLAGFLLLVPGHILKTYASRIINIHPALLPSFGGKGFYGDKVHEAVLHSGVPISGITIHHVNENFDEGEIIFQAACYVSHTETPKSLASKIHELEHRYFPVIIHKIVEDFLAAKSSSA